VLRYGSCAIMHYFTASEIIKPEVYMVLQCSHKDGIDSVGHACNQIGRPQKYIEEWSSANKCICISLTQHLLSWEIYGWQTILIIADTLISIVAIRKCYSSGWESCLGSKSDKHTNFTLICAAHLIRNSSLFVLLRQWNVYCT